MDLRVTNDKVGFNDAPLHLLLDPVDDNNAVVANGDGVVRVLGDPGHEKFFYSGFTFTCNRVP